MGLTFYEETDCQGDEELEAVIPLASFAYGCFEQRDDGSGGSYWLAIVFYQDILGLAVYDNQYCNGTVYGSHFIYDEFCDNTTHYTFDAVGDTRLKGPCNYGIFNGWPVAEGTVILFCFVS